MAENEVEAVRQKYIDALTPLFLPEDPTTNNIVNYFASLLRVVGIEDKGWDPYLESRAILEDLNSLFQTKLPKERFSDPDLTVWRLGLLMYGHIVEMDAPYEVITNLLRFRLGKGYSPNPYFDFLNKDQRKRAQRSGLYPKQKIDVIKGLSAEAGLAVGEIFDEYYNNSLRNAISHSDFIITNDEFRCRGGAGIVGAFRMPLRELNETITKSKLFIGTFFGLDELARRVWGERRGKAFPYDPVYKGIIEVLANEGGSMCGFKVHWPNNSESIYKRTEDGIDMANCFLDIKSATLEFFVGQYARAPGRFSPLVENGEAPRYTPLEGSNLIPQWPHPNN